MWSKVAFVRTQQESPELVLVNTHDRSSAYHLHAGIFCFVCSNGMILADSVFARISITHLNFEPTKVIEASFEVVCEMPAIRDGRSLRLPSGLISASTP